MMRERAEFAPESPVTDRSRRTSSRHRAERPAWFRRCALCVVAVIGTATGACDKGQETTLPQHYENKQEVLADLEDPQRDAWARPDEVVAALPLDDPEMIVADVGAGSGYFSRRIAARIPEGKVIAVDVDADFVDYVKKHRDAWGTPNVEPRLAMYENALLPEQSVDLVFVSNTYAYIRDRDAYFTGIQHALRPGGKLVIVDFRPDADLSGVENAPKPGQRVARDAVVAQIEALGFALDHEETFLPHQYYLVFERS